VSYATLMVHVELGKSNAGILNIAAGLSARFQASVIGIAACQPAQFAYGDGYISGEFVEQDRAEIEREAKEAEAEFRALLESRVTDLDWRCAITLAPLADYFAREARSADILITAADRGGSLLNNSRHVNMGDLVMRAGRPVLLLPPDAVKLQPERVLVAWKDSRETRRAALDALPLLELASHVTVVEIASEQDMIEAARRLDDVVGWLTRHGIVAEPLVAPSTGNDALSLATIAREQAADVIVAGAYGHSRLREWVLGGVTSDLLLGTNRCSLLSH
jgi:nucleotide-binding universal stress UspA family protein